MKARRFFTGILFFAVCMIIFSQTLSAQENGKDRYKYLYDNSHYRYTFSAQPLYLFSGGMRLDMEKRLSSPAHWLQIGISGLILPKTDDHYSSWENLYLDGDEEVQRMSGVGLEVGYKYLFPRNPCFYASGSLTYNYFNIDYMANEYLRFQEDGLTYYEYKRHEVSQHINRVGVNLCLGVMTKPSTRVLVDGFIGIGYRHGIPQHSGREDFNSHIFSLGYRGVTFTTGMRIGFRVK